jgi:hypothetical protein
MGFDWRNSKAHLLLLSNFRYIRNPDELINYPWNDVLSEPIEDAISRFVDEGIMRAADITELLSLKYKADQLQEMLRERGLPILKTKTSMIRRLLKADLDGMLKAVSGMKGFKWTHRGQEIAMQYFSDERERRYRLEEQLKEHLRNRAFREASLALAAYEEEEVFSNPIAIPRNPDRDVEMLSIIFSSRPAILSKLKPFRWISDDLLEELRIYGSMMALGLLLPDLSVEKEIGARMFYFYANHMVTLAEYRTSGVVMFVEILTSQDSSVCKACKKLENRKFKISAVPELPHKNCTSEVGCRCCIIPIVDAV